jgi:hypothetical protein
MKKIHKDCDLFQFIKDLREDAKLYNKQSKYAWKKRRHFEAATCKEDSEILEWVAEELECYLKTGHNR